MSQPSSLTRLSPSKKILRVTNVPILLATATFVGARFIAPLGQGGATIPAFVGSLQSNVTMSQANKRYSQDNEQTQLECPECRNVSTGKRTFTEQRQYKLDVTNVPMSQAGNRLFSEQGSTKSYDLECPNVPSPNPQSPTPLYTLPDSTPMHNHHKCPGRPNIIYPAIPLNGKAFQHFCTRGILNNNIIIKIIRVHVPSQIGRIEPGIGVGPLQKCRDRPCACPVGGGGRPLDSSTTFW